MSPPPERICGRRGVIAAIATGMIGSAAGCIEQPSFPAANVIGGPDWRNAFEPAELKVSAGRTVTWGFPNGGHNVCCRPSDHEKVVLPDSAEPFASYGPDESPVRSVVPRGETYEHTFEVPGEYVYVCIPHADQGMVGTVHVEQPRRDR